MTPGVQHDGVPDDSAYRRAMPYEMHSPGPRRTIPMCTLRWPWGNGRCRAMPRWPARRSWLPAAAPTPAPANLQAPCHPDPNPTPATARCTAPATVHAPRTTLTTAPTTACAITPDTNTTIAPATATATALCAAPASTGQRATPPLCTSARGHRDAFPTPAHASTRRREGWSPLHARAHGQREGFTTPVHSSTGQTDVCPPV